MEVSTMYKFEIETEIETETRKSVSLHVEKVSPGTKIGLDTSRTVKNLGRADHNFRNSQ